MTIWTAPRKRGGFSPMSRTSILPVAKEEFLIRPDLTFLNHGSFGACPRPVFEVYQEWQRRLEADPVEFLGRRLDDLLREAREPLAAYVGTQTDQIVYVQNATLGFNIVARSLMLTLESGDEVLATDHEYGAADRTWRFLCTQYGVKYINQPIPLPLTSDEEMIEAFWRGITPRTRVIFISHITSPTALIFPVEKICQRAQSTGIITVIDGAHAPGHIPLQLDALGVDFYTGNCHKWLCSPKGAGFLYARPERQALLQPLIVSWGWDSRSPGVSPFQDFFGWVGTDDPASFLSVPPPSPSSSNTTGTPCAPPAMNWHHPPAGTSLRWLVVHQSVPIVPTGSARCALFPCLLKMPRQCNGGCGKSGALRFLFS